MRIMPFMKRKKGLQFAGIGLDTGGGGSLPIASPATLGAIKTGATVETDANGVCDVSIPISTSEFYTGLKWTDGKKIYGKNYSLASMPTEYTKLDDLNSRNLIFAFGSVAYSNKRWSVPFFYNTSVYCTICTTDTEIQVRGTQYTTNLIVTIYYTKGV